MPDNVKLYEYNTEDKHILMLFMLESNDYYDPSYVSHVLLEMAIKVNNEVREIKAAHRKNRDLDSSRYLAGFSDDDRITAVAAIVLYTGDEDTAMVCQLSDLYRDYDHSFDDMVLHFRMKLLDPHDVSDRQMTVARGDIPKFLKVVRCGDDRERLEQLIETDEFTEIRDDSVADLIYSHLNVSADKMETFKKRRKKGEPINMRKEFQFVSDEDLATSKNEGRAEGRAETTEKIVKRMIQQNFSDDLITSVTDADEKEIHAIRLSMNNH